MNTFEPRTFPVALWFEMKVRSMHKSNVPVMRLFVRDMAAAWIKKSYVIHLQGDFKLTNYFF